MNRRELLSGSLGAVMGGKLMANGSLADGAQAEGRSCPCAQLDPSEIPSPLAKLSLKPVMTNLIHTGTWEGPCRFNVVSVQQEAESVKSSYAQWVQAIKNGKYGFRDDTEVLEPALVTFSETFTLPREELVALEQDSQRTDAYYIEPRGSSVATFDLAKRFHKPVILLGLNCRTVDIAAYARSRGEEVFVVKDNDELRQTISLLRARKVYRETRILFPTERGFPAVASLSGVTDLQHLANKYGVAIKTIPYRELANEMEKVLSDKSEQEKAEQQAGELIQGAAQSYLDRKYVVRSMQFYRTIQNLMELHGCNAFTIECFEFCSSKLPQKWTITPCLIHTLFKDRGFASSCEGDLGALLAMRLLMSVSGKSSHLGNMYLVNDAVVINHSAPGIRMNGFDKPGLPYKLGRFVESGWGTKAVVDFMQNEEKRATVARVHPSGDKVLVLKGELVGSDGWSKDNLGCSVEARIKPVVSKSGEHYVRRQAEYGNHLVWVYGDYSAEMQELGKLLGLEVELVS
jgi:hypothetical protein